MSRYDGTELEGLTYDVRSELRREMIRFHTERAKDQTEAVKGIAAGVVLVGVVLIIMMVMGV